MNVLSLCSGIGGVELGIRLVHQTARVVGYVETEAYPLAILERRMRDTVLDEAPIWTDVRTFPALLYRGKVDLIAAGFPCQPFSEAARGRNRRDLDRWPDVRRCIQEAEPWLVFLENVHHKAYEQALEDLQRMGFSVAPPFECSSAELGAVHDRRRTFVLAHADSEGQLVRAVHEEMASIPAPTGPWVRWPNLQRVDDGIPFRMDRDRALGNAVVPAMAAFAFKSLMEEMSR